MAGCKSAAQRRAQNDECACASSNGGPVGWGNVSGRNRRLLTAKIDYKSYRYYARDFIANKNKFLMEFYSVF